MFATEHSPLRAPKSKVLLPTNVTNQSVVTRKEFVMAFYATEYSDQCLQNNVLKIRLEHLAA